MAIGIHPLRHDNVGQSIGIDGRNREEEHAVCALASMAPYVFRRIS
jgi:hypothetical protein